MKLEEDLAFERGVADGWEVGAGFFSLFWSIEKTKMDAVIDAIYQYLWLNDLAEYLITVSSAKADLWLDNQKKPISREETREIYRKIMRGDA